MRIRFKLKEKISSYFRDLNPVLFAVTIALVAAGGLATYSAAGGDFTKGFFVKQMIWYAIGLTVMIIFANTNYNNLISAANFLYGFFILLLIFVLAAGREKFGAQRWMSIGAFQFQPSEFMKIVTALVIIRFIVSRGKGAFSVKNIFLVFLLAGVPLALILKQPDLGTAILLVPVVLTVFFIGNMPWKKFLAIIITGVMLLPAFFLLLKDYQKQRLEVFLDPQLDPLGAGYNVIQSQIAVGSGGLAGKGWIQGTQSQLNFIPIKYTDFVFAVISEEFGFIGSFLVVFIYFILIMEMLRIVKLCRFSGGKMLGAALAVIIFSQVFINIGMNIGMMPVTGITLPFLSYGGSSVLVVMMSLGILHNIYREYMRAEDK